MLKDDLSTFSESQAVTVTAVASRIIDGDTAGNAKLNELYLHIKKTANFATAATLTMDTAPTNGNTMVIGGDTYTWTTGATAAAGQIGIGGNVGESQAAFLAAMNGSDTFNTARTDLTAGAWNANVSILTPTAGTKGEDVTLTETFTAGTNVFNVASMGIGNIIFTLQTSATATALTALAGSPTDLVISPAKTIAAINATEGAVECFKVRIPEGALRYIGLKYTSSVTMSKGSFDAFLSFEA